MIYLMLFLNLAYANDAQDLKAIQETIENEMIYPTPVYALIKLPPKTEDADLMTLLKEKKMIAGSEKKIKALDPSVHVERAYPSYRISGLRIKLCELGIKIKKAKLTKQVIHAHGSLEALNLHPLYEKIKHLKVGDKRFQCEPREVVWTVDLKGAPTKEAFPEPSKE